MAVMYNAIENGYTVAWGSDVSEKGFTRNGIAVVPVEKAKVTAGSDQEKWVGKSTDQPKEEAKAEEKPAEGEAKDEAKK
jgi:hypothetical protein